MCFCYLNVFMLVLSKMQNLRKSIYTMFLDRCVRSSCGFFKFSSNRVVLMLKLLKIENFIYHDVILQRRKKIKKRLVRLILNLQSLTLK